MKHSQPIGVRNNNPVNIRANTIEWIGAVGEEGGFVVFESPVYGYRAAARILASYSRRGINTIEQIIGSWAPNDENNTESYVRFISSEMDLERTAVITPDQYPALLAAMTKMEVGQAYPMEQIRAGVALA